MEKKKQLGYNSTDDSRQYWANSQIMRVYTV